MNDTTLSGPEQETVTVTLKDLAPGEYGSAHAMSKVVAPIQELLEKIAKHYGFALENIRFRPERFEE